MKSESHYERRKYYDIGGYYVATHILTVWKRLAGLEPDQPHGWSFPDWQGTPFSGRMGLTNAVPSESGEVPITSAVQAVVIFCLWNFGTLELRIAESRLPSPSKMRVNVHANHDAFQGLDSSFRLSFLPFFPSFVFLLFYFYVHFFYTRLFSALYHYPSQLFSHFLSFTGSSSTLKQSFISR